MVHYDGKVKCHRLEKRKKSLIVYNMHGSCCMIRYKSGSKLCWTEQLNAECVCTAVIYGWIETAKKRPEPLSRIWPRFYYTQQECRILKSDGMTGRHLNAWALR